MTANTHAPRRLIAGWCAHPGHRRHAATAVAVLMLWAYIAVVVAANVASAHLAPLPLLDVVEIPVGSLLAGAALAARDAVHETGGGRAVAVGIALGGVVSAVFGGPALAVASTVAFVASEFVDAAVYTRLRRRGSWVRALLVSNLAGLIVDTAIFVPIAFGTWTSAPGQLIGKTTSTLAVAAAAAAVAALARSVTARRVLACPRPCWGRSR